MAMELAAFRDTRTPHDARRLANALRHVMKRPDLADEIEALAGVLVVGRPTTNRLQK